MKIAINTLAIIPGKVGGTEVFLVNLIKNLIKVDKENSFLIVVSRNNKRIFAFDSKNAEYLEFNFDNNSRITRVFFEQMILPKELKKKKVDLLIAPANVGLIYSPCKLLLIVHDLIYFVYPEYYSFVRGFYLRHFVKYSCKKADRIIALSQNTKNDIVKYTSTSEDKINVIYSGVEIERFAKIRREIAQQFILKQYGIRDYIYSPTALYKHKNNDHLIKAFAKLKTDKKISHKLIIIGGDPFNRAGWLRRLIHKYNLDKEVFYLGRISDKHIPFFYKGAALTVYISSYEGFGFPVLEAMASSCPILGSNRASLPELIGDAGIMVDPEDIREVSERMYELLINKNLREKYIVKGLARAKQFSWENCAREMFKIYNTINKNA